MGTSASKPSTAPMPTARAVQAAYDEKNAQRVLDKDASNECDSIEIGESLRVDLLDKWSHDFEENTTLALSRLVLSHSDPLQTLAVRAALIRDAKVFNLSLKGLGPNGEYPGPRVNQASSGRCWLFATTNVLRYNVIEKLRLGDFQLSQSYLFFYDKLEKANYYLENILDTLDEDIDSRMVSWLNDAPVNDGGQWDMAVNLIEKYGIIPQTLYPESFSSSSSGKLGSILTSKLREYSLALRANPASARKLKAKFLGEIYNTLSIALGTPPKPDEKILWEYYDKDNKFHSWSGTPRDFHDQFGKRKNMDPKDSFSLINDPRNEYEKLYSIDKLGNVWGGRPVRYVNAPTEALEDAVIAGIRANSPLFFGCDVGRQSSTAAGVMDSDLYDIKAAYGYSFNMNKADRLRTGETAMTHAMVITAVHVDDKGRPVRYKVENSWSESAGEKGWFMMTAEWFRQNAFQVVIPRSVAESKWTKVYDGGNPVVLPPWDPMGTLA